MMLREALDDARFYATHRAQYDANARAAARACRASDLEALLPVLRGEQPLVVTAHRASDIETALRFADEFKLKLVLGGASEAWLMRDEIARREGARRHRSPRGSARRASTACARARTTRRSSPRAGVSVVLSTFSSHHARLLWQRAGNAVRLGMDHDAAIRAVTEAPADAFGLKGYGRLEAGAVANVVVWSGDPLQIGHARRARVRARPRAVARDAADAPPQPLSHGALRARRLALSAGPLP